MNKISLEDLLRKSPEQIKNKMLNPFSDVNIDITDSVASNSPDLVEALTTLQETLENSSRKDSRSLNTSTDSVESFNPLTFLSSEIAERKGRQSLPVGLEKSVPVSNPVDSAPDDPNMADFQTFEKRVPLFGETGGGSPSRDGTEISSAPVDDGLALGGFNEERDTVEDVYRDKAGIKAKKYEPIDNSLLHGVDGERDTIQDVIQDKRRYIPNQEEDDDDDDECMENISEGVKMEEVQKITVPEVIGERNYATRNRSTFTGIGVLGKHKVNDIITGHDGYEYKIVHISMTNNGVQLRRLDTGLNSRTSYEKFFGIKPTPFPYSKGDLVKYFNPNTKKFEMYYVVGLNPASNNVQLIINDKKRFIRATKVELVKKDHEDSCAFDNE
jgi:hypothetical protein